MRVLLAHAVTSSDRSTSTIHTESLRPPQFHSQHKRIFPSLTQIPFIPLLNLYQTVHSNFSPFSTSRCPSFMVLIIEIDLYTKPTAEHQYLYAHHVAPYTINELFHSALPWEYDVYVSRRDVQSQSPQPGDTKCSYYHTHSHKRLTHAYPSSCRKPPSHSLNIIYFPQANFTFSHPPNFAPLCLNLYFSLPSYVLTSRKFANWTSRSEPELSINVTVLYNVQSPLFFRRIV